MDHLDEDRPTDLAAALALARSPRRPGPDTPAGRAVRAWPGPSHPIPDAGPGDLDLRALLRLSLAASDASGRLRPAASAGALHPVDTELVVGAGCSLPPGRYGYDPLRHRVHRLGPRPDGTLPGVTAELTVTPRRTASHYGHRALPLLLLDTGHAAAALFLAARALDTGEPEPRLDGRTERPLAAVHIPPPGHDVAVPGTAPASAAPAPGRGGRSLGSTSRLDGLAYPDGSSSGPGGLRPGPGGLASGPDGLAAEPDGRGHGCVDDPGRESESASPRPGHRSGGPPLRRSAHPGPVPLPTPQELLARRSDPPPLVGAPGAEALGAVVAAAVRAGGGELRWCVAVGGPRPGLMEPDADGTGLRRYAVGEARPTLAAWAAGQGWIAEAGAVLLARGCPSDADGPHIRRTHLRAGFAVHLAHVTARRHGLAARPVGSWQQADLGAALGAPPGQDWIVHGLALGTLHADEENTT
ncbi:SagB/ThcOx family dehydrogenase [Streptomyces sp. NPDC012769]|uniref:nitroreductase family protein n=1 Tax=Streptomyces sp. NPDC012769 TaxID=3364848 RepID=UPI0036D0287F